jgi:Na+-transporting methylmalonyl-CoA/oxaloacetate decarboxylase beta subunit
MKGVLLGVSSAAMLGSWIGAALVASLDCTTVALAAADATIVVLAWFYARRSQHPLLAMLPIGALVVFSATFSNGANFRWFGALAVLSLLAAVVVGTVIGSRAAPSRAKAPQSDP